MSDSDYDEDLYEQELEEDIQSRNGFSARYMELKTQHEASLAAFVTGASSSKKKKKRIYINREREAGGDRVYKDYFDVNPTYPPDKFRRRYRMHRPLFDRIFNAVLEKDPYFQQKWPIITDVCVLPVPSTIPVRSHLITLITFTHKTEDDHVILPGTPARKHTPSPTPEYSVTFLGTPGGTKVANLVSFFESCMSRPVTRSITASGFNNMENNNLANSSNPHGLVNTGPFFGPENMVEEEYAQDNGNSSQSSHNSSSI